MLWFTLKIVGAFPPDVRDADELNGRHDIVGLGKLWEQEFPQLCELADAYIEPKIPRGGQGFPHRL